MTGPVEDRSSTAATIARAYYPIAAAVGAVFMLIGVLSLLTGLRQWILPSSSDDFSVFGPPSEGSDAGLRSLLGAVAFVVSGAAVVAWHVREERRRPLSSTIEWTRSLYLHLVALISLVIATGAVVAMLDSLRDAAWPECFPTFFDQGSGTAPPVGAPPAVEDPLTPPPPISVEPPITIPIDPGFAPEPECYPRSSDALRNALDAGLVAVVAGGTWAWHLGRGRRESSLPPAEA